MFAAAQMRFSSFLWLDIETTAGILISKFDMLQYALLWRIIAYINSEKYTQSHAMIFQAPLYHTGICRT